MQLKKYDIHHFSRPIINSFSKIAKKETKKEYQEKYLFGQGFSILMDNFSSTKVSSHRLRKTLIEKGFAKSEIDALNLLDDLSNKKIELEVIEEEEIYLAEAVIKQTKNKSNGNNEYFLSFKKFIEIHPESHPQRYHNFDLRKVNQ